MARRLIELAGALIILAAAATAQPVITDVVNAASRIPSGFPSYGIAQGSLFAVTGKDSAPTPPQQASFPLPSTDGLAGVTVQVAVGGATVNAIIVYVSDTEVAAILPSSAPIGAGTVTLNNGGVKATAPLTVVTSAFGSFSLDYFSGVQQAAAFNLAGDGSTTLNIITQPAQPGQTVILTGTGLGPISSDETQSGATDIPNAQVKVLVGTRQATVVSAGRGPCCAVSVGKFPIPPGIAEWDNIQFIVPDGVRILIPGVDLALFTFSLSLSKGLLYQ